MALSRARTSASVSVRNEAIRELKALFADSVYHDGRGAPKLFNIVTHVAGSGMSRVIKSYIATENRMQWVSFYIANTLGLTVDRKTDGVLVRGAGMDMGFHLADGLSHAIYGASGHIAHEWL